LIELIGDKTVTLKANNYQTGNSKSASKNAHKTQNTKLFLIFNPSSHPRSPKFQNWMKKYTLFELKIKISLFSNVLIYQSINLKRNDRTC
jgi:hypothetical protein